MKKMIIGLLIIIAAVFFTGCADKKDGTPVQSQQTENNDQVKIVTSFYPMYIMALNITEGVAGVEVINMTKPITGCLHDYQLTPGDMKNLHDAKIMIINGADMESFLDDIIKRQQSLKIVDASKGLELLTNEIDGQVNPHLWVSVSGAINQVNNIGQQLAELDPTRASFYIINTAAYVKKLEDLREKMHEKLDLIENRDIVTLHEAFPYFAHEFNLNIKAVIQREPGSEPSAGELVETINVIKDSGVTALFAEPQYSSGSAETISRETGVKVFHLNPAVTGPLESDAYIQIMEENLKILEEALK